jgi:3-dehydroquinate synthase II
MSDKKEVIVEPNISESILPSFLSKVVEIGITKFLCRQPEGFHDARLMFLGSYSEIINSLENVPRGSFIFRKEVSQKSDVDQIVKASKIGAESVIVETKDWKIIPLENLIAELQKTKTKIYVRTSDVSELKTLFGVLEMGVDGVVLSTSNLEDVATAFKSLKIDHRMTLTLAKIMEIKDVGSGERACLDTASILDFGEGMLVGNQSKFLFLVHNESIESKFTSPRPFRVNAGSVHSYLLMPDGHTKYLAELQGGDEVLVVRSDGSARIVVVGRVKIERRPLRIVTAQSDNLVGSILVQNAETIRFVGKDGRIISVTEAKIGDEVLVRCLPPTGRHFGTEVDEFIMER